MTTHTQALQELISQLPVELVRDIFEHSARDNMARNARWVGQNLALTSRTVYAWVALILFESWNVRPAKLDDFYTLASASEKPCIVSHARTLIIDRFAPASVGRERTARWLFRPNFLAACTRLETVDVPPDVLAVLIRLPGFRPKIVHLTRCSLKDLHLTFDTIRPAFSRVKRIFMNEPAALSIDGKDDFVYLFPEVTHIIVRDYFDLVPSDRRCLDRLLDFPKLERLFVWLVWGKQLARRHRGIEILAAFNDTRVYHAYGLDIMHDAALQKFSSDAGPSRVDRDGRDIWNLGNPVFSDDMD
ncbi:hypothetical protein EXIGLDRAFT_834757 [Exidia glandulosa HHB12029]|uniref:F-box domain-containing protein n=1 Tax=Exidia glandulosa HHB12029 TaxID=1314781 RepID=A0A165JG16_EXIGL|nr:hypothetical protein EXIGLDRAFT_834757 [Exidia glandulosa HHB12029]